MPLTLMTRSINKKRWGNGVPSAVKLVLTGLALLAAIGLVFKFSENLNLDRPSGSASHRTSDTQIEASSKGSIDDLVMRENHAPLSPGAGPLIEIDTVAGKLRIELYPTQAPVAVAELIKLTKSGYYNSDTLLQSQAQLGFAIAKLGQSLKKFKFKDEPSALTSRRGSVAIAKSTASPAYLNNLFFGYARQPELEKHYTIIGQVVDGLQLVEKSVSGERLKVNSFKLIDRSKWLSPDTASVDKSDKL